MGVCAASNLENKLDRVRIVTALPRRLRVECAVHIRAEMESLVGQTPDCNAFLQLVDSKWQDHCSSMLTLRNIFLYLDRSFVLQAPALRSIWDMGLELFRNSLQVLQARGCMVGG